MEDNKYRKYYLEWWNIRKSTIYIVVSVLVFGGSLYFGIRYASQRNWFIADETANSPKDAGKIISFEGDVRVTRAATRETIVVTKETYVSAGDIIQTMSDGRAIVQMIDGSRYQVRPNSAMTVKQSTSIFGAKDVRVGVDDGQVNVRTNEQPEGTNNIVEVADSENRLLSNTDASFNADAATGGGEIRISRGGVETTIGGEKTMIGENEFASVNGGKLSARENLHSHRHRCVFSNVSISARPAQSIWCPDHRRISPRPRDPAFPFVSSDDRYRTRYEWPPGHAEEAADGQQIRDD